MKIAFETLVARYPADSIYKILELDAGALGIIEGRFISGGKYIIARTLFTPTWMASTPYEYKMEGLRYNQGRLEEIAEIYEYNEFYDIRKKPEPHISELQNIIDRYNKASALYIKTNLRELDCFHYKTRFEFYPTPRVLVTLASKTRLSRFLGAIAVDLGGKASLLSSLDNSLENLVKSLNSRMCLGGMNLNV